jgi:hypothetical protein
MVKRKSGKCRIDDCNEAAITSGLCNACYQFDYYHRVRGHGIAYMLKHEARTKRTIGRIRARIGARRGLRAVR